jgi:predicted nucleic acid-binding protein
MTLVDTSIWIDHLRLRDARVVQLIHDGRAGLHPFVLGELALGNFPRRSQILRDFEKFPRIQPVQEVEVHYLLENNRLWGLGLGWIDLHLLTAAVVGGHTLLTSDRALAAATTKLGIAHPAN